MPRTTLATLAAEVARLTALLDSAPVTAAASAHFAKSDIACSATPPCGRTDLRTAKRAAIHGIDVGGHAPRKA